MLRPTAQSPAHFDHDGEERVETGDARVTIKTGKTAPVSAPSFTAAQSLQMRKRNVVPTVIMVLVFFVMILMFFYGRETGLSISGVRYGPDYELPLIAPYKITKVNPNISSLFQFKEVQGYLKKRGQNENLKRESPKLGAFVEKVNATRSPIFPFVKGSTAMITSCTLETMCVTNLIYMMEFIHPDLPLELWLERGVGSKKLLNYLLSKYYPRLRVRYLDDVEPQYVKYFGPVERQEAVPPFHYKLMSIIASQYQKLFWVDSDSFLLQNVTGIIKKSRDGTLFWHDIWRIHEKNPVWKVLNMSKPVRGFSQESGILYIDKGRNWRQLYVAAYMNQKQPLYYSLFWGDKETFFLSFELLKKKYTFVPHAPFMLGKYGSDIGLGIKIPENRFDDFFGYSFVQLDLDGRAFCVHLVSGKSFILRYLRQNKRLFTVLRPYDPNRSHMDRNGLKNKTFDVRLDSMPSKMPLMASEYALGPFEERFIYSYLEAERLLEHFN